MSASEGREGTLLFIGSDRRLAYLLQRFAEQGGWNLLPQEGGKIEAGGAAAVIFETLEGLQNARALVDDLSRREIPILVCASLADESAAGELGADACLLHPLTYDQFLAALSAVCPVCGH